MIDLHMHSYYSDDADFASKFLIQCGNEASLKYMALTDHNSVKGVAEMKTFGQEQGIKVVSGIEIDCVFESTNLHLLGYGIDESNQDFYELEKNFKKLALDAVEPKIKKLRELGFVLSDAELYQLAGDNVPQEEQMAELILNDPKNDHHSLLLPYRLGGARSDMPLINFFWDFFGANKPAYVPIEFISLNATIDLVRANGGTPILAHPGANLKHKLELLAPIINVGVAGIELYSSYHSAELMAHFRKFALEHQLLISCGSDFHGKNKPLIKIGSCQYDPKDEKWLIESVEHFLS